MAAGPDVASRGKRASRRRRDGRGNPHRQTCAIGGRPDCGRQVVRAISERHGGREPHFSFTRVGWPGGAIFRATRLTKREPSGRTGSGLSALLVWMSCRLDQQPVAGFSVADEAQVPRPEERPPQANRQADASRFRNSSHTSAPARSHLCRIWTGVRPSGRSGEPSGSPFSDPALLYLQVDEQDDDRADDRSDPA
jgi:hypothetical protein